VFLIQDVMLLEPLQALSWARLEAEARGSTVPSGTAGSLAVAREKYCVCPRKFGEAYYRFGSRFWRMGQRPRVC
jgi:hypothetical protein